jgi:hypothetical protein
MLHFKKPLGEVETLLSFFLLQGLAEKPDDF